MNTVKKKTIYQGGIKTQPLEVSSSIRSTGQSSSFSNLYIQNVIIFSLCKLFACCWLTCFGLSFAFLPLEEISWGILRGVIWSLKIDEIIQAPYSSCCLGCSFFMFLMSFYMGCRIGRTSGKGKGMTRGSQAASPCQPEKMMVLFALAVYPQQA